MLYIFIVTIGSIIFSYSTWLIWCNYRFYQQIDQQFYSYFFKNCKQKRQCTIELHKITNFQWDHAYIFTMKSSNDIRSIIKEYFSINDDEAKIVFTKENKIIAHGSLDLIDDDDIADRRDKYINIYFTYTTKKIPISYYSLRPNNDELIISYGDYSVSGHKQWEGYDISPSNVQQIHLKEIK